VARALLRTAGLSLGGSWVAALGDVRESKVTAQSTTSTSSAAVAGATSRAASAATQRTVNSLSVAALVYAVAPRRLWPQRRRKWGPRLRWRLQLRLSRNNRSAGC